MKMKQRIGSVILILGLLISLYPQTFAEEKTEKVQLSLVAEQTVVTKGETVLVSILTDRDFITRGAGFTLCYDPAVLEPDLEASSAAAPFAIHGPVMVDGKTALRISFLPGAEGVKVSSEEALSAVRFKTLAAAEKTGLSLTAAWMYDESLTEISPHFPESLTIQIKSPEEPAPETKYTVRMPDDITAVIGNTVLVPVVIGNENGVSAYHAFDMTFAYDFRLLELVSTELPGLTITTEPGLVNVLGYGREREVGGIAFVLEFRALQAGLAQIRIQDARVDNSANAVMHNVSPAVLLDDVMEIAVGGYPVTLPDGFEGAATAVPGQDYCFWEPEDFYEYSVRATVNGERVRVIREADGCWVISGDRITGEVMVTATRKGKSFQVTLGTDMTGGTTARYGEDYTASIPQSTYFTYSVAVTIGGKSYSGYTVNGNSYTIPGGDIIGNITFLVTKTAVPAQPKPVTTYSVTFTGSGAGAAEGNANVIANGESYGFVLEKESGYDYQVSYQMGSKTPVVLEPDSQGRYIIPNVRADLKITIEKTLNLQVSVYEYLNLDEKTVFLILAQTELNDGKILCYEGEPMYYSEAYEAWAWLVILDYDFTESDTSGRFTVNQGASRTMKDAGGDVDCNGRLDLRDVQLVAALYNARYTDFVEINMAKFLNADVNRDRKLDILDAAAVAYIIAEG